MSKDMALHSLSLASSIVRQRGVDFLVMIAKKSWLKEIANEWQLKQAVLFGWAWQISSWLNQPCLVQVYNIFPPHARSILFPVVLAQQAFW
jgi:hypothetical protein